MTNTTTEPVDLLIHSRWIITMNEARSVLADHCLAIRDKRIVGLCPSSEAEQRFTPTAEKRLPGHTLLPGLVNAHGHSAMALLRGVAEAQPDSAEALYLLGRMLLAQGAATEAVEPLEAAARLTPEDPNVRYQLGQAYQTLGRTELARRELEAARQLGSRQ